VKNKKHEKLLKLLQQLKARKFKYTPKQEEPIDWSSYDRAQVNEINDMLNLIREKVDQAGRKTGIDANFENAGPGRPRSNPTDLAKVILMQQYFGISNRVAEGYELLFFEKMRLTKAISYKTIERAYGDPLVKAILENVFTLTQQPVRQKEHVFAVDGTGLSMSLKQNYESDRRVGKVKKGYEKLMVMVGCGNKLFSAVQLAGKSVDNESPYFGPLLSETARSYERVDCVLGDGAFGSRQNCSLVADAGGVPRLYPRKNVTLRMFGSVAWQQMLVDLVEHPQDWLREYHSRSIVESAFSVLKRDYPNPLRRKVPFRRRQEAFIRVCNYNLKRLCYLSYLQTITIAH
jgi:transposase